MPRSSHGAKQGDKKHGGWHGTLKADLQAAMLLEPGERDLAIVNATEAAIIALLPGAILSARRDLHSEHANARQGARDFVRQLMEMNERRKDRAERRKGNKPPAFPEFKMLPTLAGGNGNGNGHGVAPEAVLPFTLENGAPTILVPFRRVPDAAR